MTSTHHRKRLDALFADIERLSANPIGDAAAVRREIEELRARMRDLEAAIAKSAKRAAAKKKPSSATAGSTPLVPAAVALPPSPRRAAPSLYETERVGFAYAGDAVQPLRGPGNEASAPSDGVIVPLTASGQAIGNMQVQPPPERALTQEEMSLLNAVARQASVQIENLRLLDATERARAEAEAATRRFMHENWDSYLDGIRHSERVGYAYDQSSVTPFFEPPASDGGIRETVQVMEEQVGLLYLQPSPTRPMASEDRAMVTSIAKQIAQQVENIRLLADASRARAEAEEATRRLTRENWEIYMSHSEGNLGYVYGMNEVTPLGDAPLLENLDYSQPLTVRGETIGHLSVAGGAAVTPENAELLGEIAERASLRLETLRLTEELQKRARELQELDRLKSAFLANMSHELRTPLNSILGFSDVLLEGLDGPLTENMASDVKLIQKNGQHLLHLINDVLDMAKIESGRVDLSLESFKVHEILDEVASITSTLASEKNLSLSIAPSSDREAEIHADRTRLRQVMINLVNNAIKFTEKGRITLNVERQADDKVLIAVRDTGIGIPADKLEVIFQEFTQVDTSTTRMAGGTGLGLPISRRLIEMHGGRLWAESGGAAGSGSVFFVELPIEARLAESSDTMERAR